MLPRSALSRVPFFAIALWFACGLLASAGEARTRPRYGGTVHVAVDADPLLSPGGVALRLVFDGLTRPGIEVEGEFQPALALRWSSDNNGHRWQFWLRPGVAFQDGSPLTAVAVAASLNQSCRLTACAWSGVHIAGQSLVFTGDEPMPNLPAILARPEFLVRQLAATGDGEPGAPIGTGPFRVKEARSAMLRLEANEDCWQGRPFANAVEFSIRRTGRDEWAELGLGKIDLIEISPSEIRAARQQQLRVMQAPDVALLALGINNPNLAPQLRAAIALSVDRAALQQVIFQKQAEVSASLLPASLSGYSFLFPTDRDLPGAVAQRGGVNPPPLTLAADASAPMQLAAQRLALNLHDAGFTVKVVPLIPGVNVTQRADLVLRTLPVAGGSPAATLEWILHSLGLNTPVAASEPVVAFQAEREFLAQHTVVPLLLLPRAWAASSRLRDLRLGADGLPDIANASLVEGELAKLNGERAP